MTPIIQPMFLLMHLYSLFVLNKLISKSSILFIFFCYFLFPLFFTIACILYIIVICFLALFHSFIFLEIFPTLFQIIFSIVPIFNLSI